MTAAELIVDDFYGSQRLKPFFSGSSRPLPVDEPAHGDRRDPRRARRVVLLAAKHDQGYPRAPLDASELDNALQELVGRLGRNDPEVRRLTNIYHNLIRYWAEL